METNSPETEMGTVTNLLRTLAEALAPYITTSTNDEVDFNDQMVDWCSNEGVITESTFDPSDYDLLTEGTFDPSDYGLVTDDKFDHKVEQAIDEMFTNNSIVIDDLVTRDDIGDIVSVEVSEAVNEAVVGEVTDLLGSEAFRVAVGEALAHILTNWGAVRD